MEQNILELVLNYYRSPSQYPELVDVDAPLPQGIDFLLELVSGKVELDTDELQGDLKGVPANDLKAAAVFYIEHVLFNSNANFYRTLGLNINATQDQIRHHYGVLIHILCLDQGDKSAQWDEAYAMQINRAYSVLRIPEKREKYNKQHNIVYSEFSGVEKRGESRKVLGGSKEQSTEEQSSAGKRGSISSSFIAANIDRAYLSKDNAPVVKEAAVVSREIDSASPENLYAPQEAAVDAKQHTERNKKVDDNAVALNAGKTKVSNVDESSSRKGVYSLFGIFLLLAIGAVAIYFSGKLRPVSDVSDEYKTTILESEEIVEVIKTIPDENSIDNLDLGEEESIELVEPEESHVVDTVVIETVEAEAIEIEAEHNENDGLKDIVESVQLEDMDVVTENIETPHNEGLGLTDENEVQTEFEQEYLDGAIGEFIETEDVAAFTDAEQLNEPTSEEGMLFDSDDFTEVDQEIADEISVEELNAEKLSAVVRDFVRYYDTGDLGKFIQLFAEDAKTDDRENRSGIREDYADAFNLTVKRKFLVDQVQWVMLDEKNGLGTANFVLFIQALGEDRFAEYTGEITFYIESRDDVLLITGLYHQYSE